MEDNERYALQAQYLRCLRGSGSNNYRDEGSRWLDKRATQPSEKEQERLRMTNHQFKAKYES